MSGIARFRPYALLCALLVLLAALASDPVAEIGINDDWSYVRSAFMLGQTGHIVYMGWASAMLGWILPVGALFAKLFGFSFTAVRASGVLIAALNAFVLHRCFARAGLSERNGTFATLTVILCPVYLPLATSFMTDLPGMMVVLLCFYGCMRAVQATGGRASVGWLLFACAVSSIGGTARQTAWLGAMVMVPSAAYLLRRRRLSWWLLGVAWVASMLWIYAALRWFRAQPYSLGEALVGAYVDRDLLYAFVAHMARALLELLLLLVPVTVAFVPHVRWRTPKILRWTIGALAAVALFSLYCAHTHQFLAWLAPFDGNYFSEKGLVDIVEIGRRPDMLGAWSRLPLTALTVLGTIAAVGYCLAPSPVLPDPRERAETPLDWYTVAVLTVPFTAAYFALMVHRALFERAFDRYLLVVLFVPLLFLVRLYQERIGRRLPAICLAFTVASGVFTVAANHDLFAMQRARLAATEELTRSGIDRSRFFAGWEYDGWTQVDHYGFVNSGWMMTPQGFTRVPPIPYNIHPSPCKYGWAEVFPAIHAEYAVSFSPDSCAGPSGLPPVEYRTWLPPHRAFFYIQRVAGQAR